LLLYRECTGRAQPSTAPATEGWLICGRRSGKSFMLALIAVYLATFKDHRHLLAPGERGTILIVSPDRKQSRVILRFIKALLTKVPMLARMVEREVAEGFDLSNGVTIEVGTACDQKARTRLDRLNFQIFSVDGELASLAAALAEASARLTLARQAEARLADREAAKQLLAQLKRFRDFARSTDDALSALVASTVGMQDALRAMHVAGSNFPSDAQLMSLGGRVLLAAMSRTPFRRNFETLPPLERDRSMTQVVNQWAATVERSISERLGEQSNNEAA
jgi:hypothetical protein